MKIRLHKAMLDGGVGKADLGSASASISLVDQIDAALHVCGQMLSIEMHAA